MGKSTLMETSVKSSDLKGGLREEPDLWKIIGSSKEIKSVFKSIEIVLDSDVPVIIQGETGTGKELVARAIHFRGPRRNYPFCAINCAAIPENLMESELFGYEKGAYTGATEQHMGKFERSDMGTLFFDEINGMSPATQTKILRVVEEQEFERVGGKSTIKTNVRIVSASNKDLLSEVRSDKFREDLYYRIAVFRIEIPPLRERKDDIPELVNSFVKRYSTLSGNKIKNLDSRTMDMIVNYSWPGNIRQLQNSIKRAILVATPTHDKLLPEHFDFPDLNGKALRGIESLEDGLSKLESSLRRSEVIPLEEVEEVFIRQALSITKGNISKAADKLGISRSTIYRKMQEHGIQTENPHDDKQDNKQ